MAQLNVLSEIRDSLSDMDTAPKRFGKVTSVIGTVIEASGLKASVGELHLIQGENGYRTEAEVKKKKNDTSPNPAPNRFQLGIRLRLIRRSR